MYLLNHRFQSRILFWIEINQRSNQSIHGFVFRNNYFAYWMTEQQSATGTLHFQKLEAGGRTGWSSLLFVWRKHISVRWLNLTFQYVKSISFLLSFYSLNVYVLVVSQGPFQWNTPGCDLQRHWGQMSGIQCASTSCAARAHPSVRYRIAFNRRASWDALFHINVSSNKGRFSQVTTHSESSTLAKALGHAEFGKN